MAEEEEEVFPAEHTTTGVVASTPPAEQSAGRKETVTPPPDMKECTDCEPPRWSTKRPLKMRDLLFSAVGLLNLRPPSALRLDLFLKFVRYDFQNL